MSCKLQWRLGTLFLVALLALTMFPPVATEAAKKQILRVGHREPDTLDPHKALLGTTQPIIRFLYRGLTRFAMKDGMITTAEVEPDLAEHWTVSEDGLVWTFHLRKGVKFHRNFGDMTADDVKFSYERQMSDAKGMRFGKELIVMKDIKIVDPYTVQITLKSHDPVFLLRLAGYQQGYIVSKKAVEQYGDKFEWNPVGTGPFYFDQHLPREKIVLKAHKDYYFGRSKIDEVQYFDVPEDATKMIGIEKGTFDVIYPNLATADMVEQAQKVGVTVDQHLPGGQYRIYLNHTKPPFDDLRVRQAFMHAVNRKKIIETLYPKGLGLLSVSPLPPGYFGHLPVEIPEYNPEKAKALLKEAGHPNGFTVKDYFMTTYAGYPKIMTLVQEDLKQVGINVEVQPVEHATYHQNIRRNLNPFVLYGGTRLTDGDIWFSLFFHSSEIPNHEAGRPGTNFAHYKAIDNLIDEARQQRDSAQRQLFYHEAQKRIMQDAICLPIVEQPNTWIRNQKRVKTPFKEEFNLHYGYNYPEMFTLAE